MAHPPYGSAQKERIRFGFLLQWVSSFHVLWVVCPPPGSGAGMKKERPFSRRPVKSVPAARKGLPPEYPQDTSCPRTPYG